LVGNQTSLFECIDLFVQTIWESFFVNTSKV
jgi:hypothetical protein